ncbi:hypothetical protein [Streptomyces clavuligerus]|uniref:Putative membrane protein n=1 Tax=Streptomyces clavuligerus TaxID=1901 RepID=E2Q4K0_STRCL|nr:hypothetical protein [Streptomyces clavuligerus]ANW20063.1 hypothetical protein BB341_18510 [Streptomyces clavuligerus]AXU14687.1 hypothetical protein D1794_19330 [Streptomyces clavuligerus]EFG07038.1 Putative membrane protein [Streptomyces clavuligerus]MBY6304709.1 hypothetical protein [Streptomyces clavuligerus]QCS07457.1 hypothetical protein CRV15_18685 [Streptomyces clavuligerus]
MSLISTLARLEAVESGRAQPLATVRHRHIGERPLVLVPLTTAGEAGAPLGALVGTDRERPVLLTVAQPRDRELRFAFLAALADTVLPYIESHAAAVEAVERMETDPATGRRARVETELCADAPQIVVPGRAAIGFVQLLGRSMRFRRTAEQDPDAPYPAPPYVPLLGRWLTHYGERARVPGSSLLLAATDLLGRHWATGQSSVEDQHLGALLAWIDPPDGRSGAEAALWAETARDAHGQLLCPPAGPATDPAFDNKVLAPAVEAYDRARQALAAAEDGAAADERLGLLTAAEREIGAVLRSQLEPTWRAVWHALDLLRELPEGARVADRWTRDRWSFTAHRDRVRAGEPPQPRRDDAVTAARKLAVRESAQARLDAQEALDDPLVLAGRRLAGEAFAAEVTEVAMAWTESKRPAPRPLLTLRTDDTVPAAEGLKVYRCLDGRQQSAELVRQEADSDGSVLVLRLLDRMGRARDPAEGTVPEKGDRIVWTLFEHDARGGPKLPEPEETPWTHGGPPDTAAESPDPVTPEDLL